ncbi:PilZ domain-containing protein [Salinibius halmophilus]|uniref:PilZ domain-containing protein n=1 Tax=Salinibius halmophilus TaxID=1853216 RepID=UPI000E661D97|nr:PilZ domain-containing protein [Salinibius halmophilus]
MIPGAGGFMSLNLSDKAVLYASYMPFVVNGGIFIATNRKFKMGDEVFCLLSLPEEADKIPVTGKVCWITPRGAQNNRVSGVGIQFNEKSILAKDKIEKQLAGLLNSDKITSTM